MRINSKEFDGAAAVLEAYRQLSDGGVGPWLPQFVRTLHLL
jgi:hypothetical protein